MNFFDPLQMLTAVFLNNKVTKKTRPQTFVRCKLQLTSFNISASVSIDPGLKTAAWRKTTRASKW